MELENDNFLDLVFWFLNFFPNENQHHNLEKGFIQTNMHMTLAQAMYCQATKQCCIEIREETKWVDL